MFTRSVVIILMAVTYYGFAAPLMSIWELIVQFMNGKIELRVFMMIWLMPVIVAINPEEAIASLAKETNAPGLHDANLRNPQETGQEEEQSSMEHSDTKPE